MESMYKESLFQAISKGEVVLWAGAGLSLYAGLPSGVQLREILYEGLTPLEKEEVGKESELSHLADEICVLKGNRNYIIQTLKDTFRRDFLSTETHKVISQIPHFRNIITTNYDSLFESVYGSGKLNIIFSDDHTPYIDDKKVNLFKIHGDLSAPNSIIITESDYNNFFSKDTEQNTIWSIIKGIIATKSILFIGYSLEDTNVEVVFNKIRDKIGENGKECYFVAPNISTTKSKKLIRAKIHPISLTGEKLFEELIEYLTKNITNDFKNKYISSDIYSEFIGNFGLKSEIELDSSIGKNIVKNLTGIEGKDTKIEMSFSVSDSFEGINKLKGLISTGSASEGVVKDVKIATNVINTLEKNNILENSISGEDISEGITIDKKFLGDDFSLNINGINFMDINSIKNLTLILLPSFDEQVDIIFENKKEFNDVRIKVVFLNLIERRVKVIVQLYDNQIEIETCISTEEATRAILYYRESKQINNISKQISFFELIEYFSEGQSFSVYIREHKIFDSKKSIGGNLKEGFKSLYEMNHFYFNYFKKLKEIERLGNLRFSNININDVTSNNFNLLEKIIAKFNSPIEEKNPKIPLKPECFDYTEYKDNFALRFTENLDDIVIHNQTFKMGEVRMQISDAFISNYEEIINDRTISPIVESRSKRAIITFNN
ncbi:SIR2 family NAD-dependent protein deacylase [Capnocytophaga endodontalis]|uniref:SIR2 family protein n=1 Tax=Capnocytophaga endodontalis TaxID=2708117 RepID=A0A1Z4BNV4_9FLAO|nr:SIR2 family protein [Capnocytophaga endodontalis]ASF42971.1 SIR2 family protein [Capnocytophaga endodontalis]